MLNFHVRMPSIDHGVVSALWAILFGAFIWLGLVAIEVDHGQALVIAGVAAFLIFLYVRVYGEEQPRRR